MELKEWQLGDESEMTSLQRMIAHNEWLKEIHNEIREKILKEKKKEDTEEIIGGFDDQVQNLIRLTEPTQILNEI